MDDLKAPQLNAWRLFITAHSRLIAHFEAEMNASGEIPLHWYDVLIELYEAPEHKLRMSELADRVVLSRSGLTRLVDNLEKAGLLTRADDPTDRRGAFAVITEAGKNAIRRAWPTYAHLIQTQFGALLTEPEAETLTALFEKILANLKQQK
jgi:DNA-binding MarR family transcriptional regulator